jgi:hypothetical protein
VVHCLEKHIVAHTAAQKIPERGPDQLGAIGGECCVANGPDRMEKLEQELQLSVS